MNIELADVVLRNLEPRDLEALHRFRNDRTVTRSLMGFSTGYSRRDLEEWMEYHRSRKDEIMWTMADKKTDECFGHAGLYQIDQRVGKAEVGMCIGDKTRWSKGLATQIMIALVDFAFDELNLHKIYAFYLESNRASARFTEKLGYHVDGRLRHDQYRDGEYLDVVAISVLREEWKERRRAASSSQPLIT